VSEEIDYDKECPAKKAGLILCVSNHLSCRECIEKVRAAPVSADKAHGSE